MTIMEIETLCGAVCPNAAYGKCAFVQSGIMGFIDTSARLDGTRGIAFSREKMTVNTDGFARELRYGDIRLVRIIDSFENSFADELVISGESFEVRISDYSLDKTKLKELIDLLRNSNVKAEETAEQIEQPKQTEQIKQAEEPDRSAEEMIESAGEVFEDGFSDYSGEEVFSSVIPETIPENFPQKAGEAFDGSFSEHIYEHSEKYSKEQADYYSDKLTIGAEIPEEADESIYQEDKEIFAVDPQSIFSAAREFFDIIPEENAVIPEYTEPAEAAVFAPEHEDDHTGEESVDFDEQAEFERISSMSREQTVSYIAEAFAEINGAEEELPDIQPRYNPVSVPSVSTVEKLEKIEKTDQPVDESLAEVNSLIAQKADDIREILTAEPSWGDIYIKASRSLRELCEQNRLSMDAIRAELNERLLSSARAFAEITSDESKIPKVLMPRITELKSAAKNYEEYFSYGEDIGTRAMFFMLFQMLSYADRIVENPEAKERLNDFFRRFGSAGIILSMLDMRF